MNYLLTAKTDVDVWNTLQKHHLIKNGDKFVSTKTDVKDNCSFYTIDIDGVPTLYDHKDIEQFFNIRPMMKGEQYED